MAWFPMFIQLEGARALLIGGGKTALGKAQRLEPYGVTLHVVAPAHVSVRAQRVFCPEDLEEDFLFVIAATDDREANHRVSQLCHEKRIPVNVVDTPEDCSFLFPALVRRGPLSIGISTGGASPSGARRLKDDIDRMLPSGIGDILTWLDTTRPAIKARVSSEAQRKTVFDLLYSRCVALGRPLTEAELQALLEDFR